MIIDLIGAKDLRDLKVKVKAAAQQWELQQHPLLCALGKVPLVPILHSPAAEPSYNTEYEI